MDLGFMGPEAYTEAPTPCKKKDTIMATTWARKVSVYLK